MSKLNLGAVEAALDAGQAITHTDARSMTRRIRELEGEVERAVALLKECDPYVGAAQEEGGVSVEDEQACRSIRARIAQIISGRPNAGAGLDDFTRAAIAVALSYHHGYEPSVRESNELERAAKAKGYIK